MRNILSLYSLKYPAVATYLLQSNEYNVRWYLEAYWSVRDFNEIIKHLPQQRTTVFNTVLNFNWLILLSLYSGAIASVILFGLSYLVLAVGIIVLAPIIMALSVVIPLFVADIFIRKPRERQMVSRTAKKLSETKATKIAIAGSYGKTTMKEILTAVLGAKLKVAATPGNYNTPVGISRFTDDLHGDEDVLIVEMGEYTPGDIAKMSQIVLPDFAFITGINEQHLQRMKSLENIISTIFALADYVAPAKLLLNDDSPLVKQNKKPKNIAYNAKRAGGWKAKNVKLSADGTDFTAVKGKHRLKLHTSLLGSHQIGPLLAAVYMADKLGLSDKQIIKGVASIRPQGRRFNPRTLDNGAIFIDDTYNGNPDGFAAGIKFLDELGGKKKRVYITGGIIELGREKERIHHWIGSLLAKSDIEKILLIRTPAGQWIAEGLRETNPDKKFEWIETSANIYENIEQFTSSDEIVLMQNWQREDIAYEL